MARKPTRPSSSGERGERTVRRSRGPSSGRAVSKTGPAARDPAPVRDLGSYVYCIVGSAARLRFGALGIGDAPADVRTVHFRDLAAIVSATPLVVHDPTRANILAHQRVNDAALQRHTVLPMSFGAVFRSDADVVELLRSAYDAFTAALRDMQGKVELGLKVLWDRDRIVREIELEEEDLGRLKQAIQSPRRSAYFARMQYSRLMDSALQRRSDQYVEDIGRRLREVSVDARVNKPIGDRMIMNAAFLVERTGDAAFEARLRALGGRHDALTFTCTGPWPPWNFVNIRLKLEQVR